MSGTTVPTESLRIWFAYVAATNRGVGSPIIILGTCPLGLYAVLMTNQILHLTNQPTTIMPNCKKFTGKLNGGEDFFLTKPHKNSGQW
jgi:hypothetical protein